MIRNEESLTAGFGLGRLLAAFELLHENGRVVFNQRVRHGAEMLVSGRL